MFCYCLFIGEHYELENAYHRFAYKCKKVIYITKFYSQKGIFQNTERPTTKQYFPKPEKLYLLCIQRLDAENSQTFEECKTDS